MALATAASSFRAERFVGLRYLLRPRRSKKIWGGTATFAIITLSAIANFLWLADVVRTPGQELFFNVSALLIAPSAILFATFALLNFFSVLTAVSVVGVMLGVGSLTVVFSVTSGFLDSFRDKILGVNAHAIIMKYGLDFAEYRDVMTKVDADPEVAASAPFLFNEMLVASSRASTGVLVKGIDPTLTPKVLDLAERLQAPAKVSDLAFDAAPSDGSLPLPGIIVGRDLARKLKVKIGDRVRAVSPKTELDPQKAADAHPSLREFRVAGVFYSGFGEYDQKLAYVALRDAQAFFPYGDVVMGVELKLRHVDQAQDTAQRLLKLLGGHPFRTLDWRELNRNLFAAVEMQRQLLLLIMLVIVVVASFNIIAALTMLVVQKTREVAILSSLGLSRLGVGRLFVTAGLGIGAVGTILGVLEGLLVCWLVGNYRYALDAKVYLIDQLPVRIQPLEIALTVLAALVLSFFAALYPAYRASGLSPIEGLRYD